MNLSSNSPLASDSPASNSPAPAPDTALPHDPSLHVAPLPADAALPAARPAFHLLSPRLAESGAEDAGEPHQAESSFHEHAGEEPGPFAPGRMWKYLLQSALLPDDREISIYLPAQYQAEPGRRFPVFYLHDGQNLFDPRTSYVAGRTWQAHSTMDRLVEAREIEPVILVGVAHTGVRRMAEYTPSADPKMGGGEGALYGRLLLEELKPFIDRTFRTLPGSSSTALGGSSLGGLISLYLGLQHPTVFGKLGVLSPSIWWDRRNILHLVAKLGPQGAKDLGLRIWLDIGTGEGERHVRDTDLLHRLLVHRGWTDGTDLAYLKVWGGVHTEDAWAQRFDQVLRFLFPA